MNTKTSIIVRLIPIVLTLGLATSYAEAAGRSDSSGSKRGASKPIPRAKIVEAAPTKKSSGKAVTVQAKKASKTTKAEAPVVAKNSKPGSTSKKVGEDPKNLHPVPKAAAKVPATAKVTPKLAELAEKNPSVVSAKPVERPAIAGSAALMPIVDSNGTAWPSILKETPPEPVAVKLVEAKPEPVKAPEPAVQPKPAVVVAKVEPPPQAKPIVAEPEPVKNVIPPPTQQPAADGEKERAAILASLNTHRQNVAAVLATPQVPKAKPVVELPLASDIPLEIVAKAEPKPVPASVAPVTEAPREVESKMEAEDEPVSLLHPTMAGRPILEREPIMPRRATPPPQSRPGELQVENIKTISQLKGRPLPPEAAAAPKAAKTSFMPLPPEEKPPVAAETSSTGDLGDISIDASHAESEADKGRFYFKGNVDMVSQKFRLKADAVTATKRPDGTGMERVHAIGKVRITVTGSGDSPGYVCSGQEAIFNPEAKTMRILGWPRIDEGTRSLAASSAETEFLINTQTGKLTSTGSTKTVLK